MLADAKLASSQRVASHTNVISSHHNTNHQVNKELKANLRLSSAETKKEK
jgi:hypothetical protein